MNNYLAKGLFIIEHKYKQLISLLNDTKLRIHKIDKKETDFLWQKTQ